MEEEKGGRPSKRQKLDTPISVSDDSSDSDDEKKLRFYKSWKGELIVPDWAVKYRAAIDVYLHASHYRDVTTESTYEYICQITGYEFDKAQRKVIKAICRGLVLTKRKQFAERLKVNRPGMWYAEGAAKRQRLRERMAHLQKKRLRKEKKKKKQPLPIVKDYPDDEYAQEMYNGYHSEDDEGEYFYPGLGGLSDSELLENSPIPTDMGRVSEEINIARMIRETYKIDVEIMRKDIRSQRDPNISDKNRFRKFLLKARRSYKGQKLSTADYNKQDAKLDKETLETYISDSLWRTPTNARLSFLDHFNRDWGLSKAYYYNTYLAKEHEILPTPVYLVDPAMRTFSEPKLRAKRSWKMVDNVGTDPFARRTYYLSDPLAYLMKQRLARHSDVIGKMFRQLHRVFDKQSTLLRGDEFKIVSKFFQKVFFNHQVGDYISWADAAKFLFEHHYFIVPGRPLRPVDPIFYPDIAHKEYISREGPRRNKMASNEIATFYTCGSTSYAWHRPFPESLTFDQPSFADEYRKPRAFVRWLGKEILSTHPPLKGRWERKVQATAEFKAQFREEYERYSKEELETGKLWRVQNRRHPSTILTSEYNGFEVTWYSMWRRPWIRNLEFSVDEIEKELHNLYQISKSQEDKWVEEGGMMKRVPSRYLESEFVPGQHRKPYAKPKVSIRPFVFCTSYPENEHRGAMEVDPDHGYDQGVFGPSGSKLGMQEPRSEPLNLTYSRHIQMGPDQKERLKACNFDKYYNARRGKAVTHRHSQKQYYLCYSEDEEDNLGYQSEFDEMHSLRTTIFRSKKRMKREKIERDERRKAEGRDVVDDQVEPVVEEVESSEDEKSSEDEPVNLDSVNEPIITELESSDDDAREDEGDTIQVVDGNPTIEEVNYEPIEEYQESDDDEEEHFFDADEDEEEEEEEEEEEDESSSDDGPIIEEIE